MRVPRTVVFVAILSALSASAGAFVISDPANTLEHSFLNGWRQSILYVLGDEVRQIVRWPNVSASSPTLRNTRRPTHRAGAHAASTTRCGRRKRT